MNPYADVVVIGGGSAGLMAAIAAARAGADTLLLEKGDRLGRKLLISGGGRCNVTNAKGIDHILQNVPGNGKFLQSALHQWSNEDIISFFAELGVPLKEEDRGRMFPASNRATTVLSALVDHLRELGVRIWMDTPVRSLQRRSTGEVIGVTLQSGIQVKTSAVVVASGGCSVPQTGSTGDGYAWAKAAGHSIVTPYPTSVAVVSQEQWIIKRVLQGTSLRNIALTVYNPKGKEVCREEGDMIFTHFGLSGPAALRVSQYIVKLQQQWGTIPIHISLDMFPEESWEELRERIRSDLHRFAKKNIRNVARDWTLERIADFALSACDIEPDTVAAQVKNRDVDALASFFKKWTFTVAGTEGLAKATVTGGGVPVKEINPTTMESRLARGLFFAGEVMDVHAHTGGYNITVAFSSGHVAGTSAAMHAAAQVREVVHDV